MGPATVALPAAQLAIARGYGFAGWPELTAEVEHRRPQPGRCPAAEVLEGDAGLAAHLLRSRTGQDVDAWNRRVAGFPVPGPTNMSCA